MRSRDRRRGHVGGVESALPALADLSVAVLPGTSSP